MKAQKKVGFLFYEGFTPLQIAVAGAFDVANRHAEEALYSLTMLSPAGGAVRGPIGVTIETEAFSDEYFDLLVVAGAPVKPEEQILEFLKVAPSRCKRIAGICSGTFALAEAGLLEGRRATTHWKHAKNLQTKFPGIKVDANKIFIADGPFWTCAGSTAGLDLALSLIEEDFGIELARTIARFFVMYHRRSGGQSQFSTLLELEPKSDRMQKVVTHIRRHLNHRLSVEELADVAVLSPRQFSRAFQLEVGESPAKAVENLRLEAARNMMEDSNHTLDTIAQETGFGDTDRMRRAFVRAFGQSPQMMRRVVENMR